MSTTIHDSQISQNTLNNNHQLTYHTLPYPTLPYPRNELGSIVKAVKGVVSSAKPEE